MLDNLFDGLTEWVDNPLYRSRKFIYALGTLLAAIVVWLLPQIAEAFPGLELTPTQIKTVSDMLPLVFVLGLALIAGHTATDIAAIWKEGVKARTIQEAITLLLAALDNQEPVMDELQTILEENGVKLE